MKLGQIVVTRGISQAMKDIKFAQFIADSMLKYVNKNWGDICDEDKQMNDSAVQNNDDRIVARYGDIYIITEWDRSVTTILFTHEY